jgi:fructose-specific phosphotransferase system IIC component
MSEDKQAQVEVWIHKKPRRIIHNFWLAQLLMILCITVPIPAGGVLFWLVFAMAPSIVIPVILVGWAVSAAVYAVLRLHFWSQDRK